MVNYFAFRLAIEERVFRVELHLCIKSYLIIESEVIMGKSQTKALLY